MASLTAKTGVLGHHLAAHLLRRTTFHPTKALIDAYAAKTVAQAIDDLMAIQALNVEIPIDWETGLPWLEADTGLRYTEGPNVPTSTNGRLRHALKGWWLDNARLDQTIHHKMAFFLHSIWVVAMGEGAPEEYWDYLRLLRESTLGSYKTLAVRMTKDNQMLRYLDNNANNDNSPNENYAREFLELFTIGKGEQISEGDYTNYTETDVVEGAKVLTGWKNGSRETDIDAETGLPTSNPNYSKHEEADKTFSSAFQNQVITAAVDEADMHRELDDYINMIFAQDATALTICRRIYTYFVGRYITDAVEADIIVPLANTMRTNDYNLEIVLRELLSSVHFYDEDDAPANEKIIGSMMKSPMEKVFGALNYLNIAIPDPYTESYNHYNRFYKRCFIETFGDKGGMFIFTPTNVAGYPAYYQTPGYHRNWFNSSTVISRYKLPEQLILGKRVLLSGDLGTVQLNVVSFISTVGQFTDPGDATLLVTELSDYMFCETPDADRIQYFVDVLTGDFDEAYWANLWSYYANTYDEDEVKTPLEDLMKSMMYAPEYQLM